MIKKTITYAEMPWGFMPVDLGPGKAHLKSKMRRNLDMPDEIKNDRAPDPTGKS